MTEKDEAPATTETEIRLVSVNVGLPHPIGMRRGKPVLSGIGKVPTQADVLLLDRLNLAGDGQADLTVHGGPNQAVYAYPVEHIPRWNEGLGLAFGPGTFGENLTTEGVLETDVFIGDVWAWGEARLQVTKPRQPCYKLAMVTGRPDLLKRFIATGRTGWYLRVLEPGHVPVRGPIRIVDRDPDGVTVLDLHRQTINASDQVSATASAPPTGSSDRRRTAAR